MNTIRIKMDIRVLENNLRILKKSIRMPFRNITREESARLRAWKKEVTVLCAIQAHRRGRVHLRGQTLDDQAILVGARAQEYA
jgi:hypothetical protein